MGRNLPLPPMRLLASALLLGLAACTPPQVRDDAPVPPTTTPAADGLSADQRAALADLGIPVLVPGDVGAFELETFEADSDGTFGSYRLRYRRADGACFEVSGTNEGLGGPEWPPVSTEARIADLGRTVRVHQAADDPDATSAQVWGVNTVVSEYIDLDGTGVLFLSNPFEGCRPVSLAEGAALVADLRLLAAGEATPATDLGPFAPADDVLDGYTAASSPEAVAQAVANRYGRAVDRVEVRVLSETDYEATALVTAFGLRDDSVRDERLRLTVVPAGGSWELVGAARQVRCWPGRGHEDWGPDRCL